MAKASKKPTAKASASVLADQKRSRLSQQDVPSCSVERALRVARAIGENYGFKPSSPIQVARALNVQPTSGPFRMLAGASIAYGLTTGGYNAETISLEPLAMRIVRPTAEGDDLAAKREALLKPRVIGDFLRKYDGAPLPREDIAENVLAEMGVPSERTKEVLDLIIEGAQAVGYVQEIKGRQYVEIDRAPSSVPEESPPASSPSAPPALSKAPAELNAAAIVATLSVEEINRARRVFLTHGKNRTFIDPAKKLLAFGELEAVVSAERQSVAQPVPDKVMSDMRGCGAAIIHVDEEMRLLDQSAQEHIVLNPNVLIEIGAAMALYGRRFILLVKDGVKLPSNLQGLYEVRYRGDALDGDATIKLLEAINDIKNHPLPSHTSEREQPKV